MQTMDLKINVISCRFTIYKNSELVSDIVIVQTYK